MKNFRNTNTHQLFVIVLNVNDEYCLLKLYEGKNSIEKREKNNQL
jgi:hypothetical protein